MAKLSAGAGEVGAHPDSVPAGVIRVALRVAFGVVQRRMAFEELANHARGSGRRGQRSQRHSIPLPGRVTSPPESAIGRAVFTDAALPARPPVTSMVNILSVASAV